MTTNHTFRLASLSQEKLASTVEQNVSNLEQILERLALGPLRLFRIGSSFIPFASHRSFQFQWPEMAFDRLSALGARYSAMGFRFSMHPGQYTILNAPDEAVVSSSLAEIEYACRVLDSMSLDRSHKIVVHGGGLYGDREGSTARLTSRLRDLPERLRARLVLENDERYFNLEEIVKVSEEAGIPAVFDLHHHQINPIPNAQHWLRRLESVWDCRPKVHLSSQKPGARVGAHDQMLTTRDLAAMCDILPFEADLMVEAKAKEVAAMAAYEWLNANGRLSQSL